MQANGVVPLNGGALIGLCIHTPLSFANGESVGVDFTEVPEQHRLTASHVEPRPCTLLRQTAGMADSFNSSVSGSFQRSVSAQNRREAA